MIGLPWPSSWEALRIDVPALKADGEPLEDAFSLPVPLLSHWGLDYRFPHPVAFRVRASRQGERILVEVGMKGVLVVPCSRCLAPASASMEGEGEFAFRLGPEGRQESEDEDGEDAPQEDVQELDAWADRVELAPLFWEVLVTALPSGVLCKEDCRGLCPHCGADRNVQSCQCEEGSVDPRLEALRRALDADEEFQRREGK